MLLDSEHVFRALVFNFGAPGESEQHQHNNNTRSIIFFNDSRSERQYPSMNSLDI